MFAIENDGTRNRFRSTTGAGCRRSCRRKSPADTTATAKETHNLRAVRAPLATFNDSQCDRPHRDGDQDHTGNIEPRVRLGILRFLENGTSEGERPETNGNIQ